MHGLDAVGVDAVTELVGESAATPAGTGSGRAWQPGSLENAAATAA